MGVDVLTDKQARKISKQLSFLLRHKPHSAGLQLDESGWTDLQTLSDNIGVCIDDIKQVVATNDKQRFTIKDGKIRANQGHSVEVDLKLDPKAPPAFLYHGTYPQVHIQITRDGLKKMKRHHVHLSPDVDTARLVGARRSRDPVIFMIDSASMHDDGFEFFESDNGVWLVDEVPPKYLTRVWPPSS